MDCFSLLNFIAWNFDGWFPHIKSEEHENEICNWSMQSPFDHLIFVLKGIGISSFHHNFQHQIKSHLAMKNFAGTKIREYHIEETHFEGMSILNTMLNPFSEREVMEQLKFKWSQVYKSIENA